ncbi:MAG: fold metallo-hydrolase [Thermoproteota archaeon]|nr:fold metallo-hydrolase [Thermoproteota archaeon]
MSEVQDRGSTKRLFLKEVDRVEILSLMDNSVDLLSTIDNKDVKPVREWVEDRKGTDWTERYYRSPSAEHGFSMLIRVTSGGKSHSILFDCGASKEGVVSNIGKMGLDLSEVETVVLSHSHNDHSGGLLGVLKAINRADMPIIVHEDMFKTRGVANPDGSVRKRGDFPDEDQVKPARYVKTKEPLLLANDGVLVTGEIPRKMDFEKGFPQQRVLIEGDWKSDPWVWDDRAITINVKHKGLVIVSGCAHAGIINTAINAIQVSGVRNVTAIIGGFHLAGGEYEPRINRTVEELKQLKPKMVVPTHCSGWRGFYAIRNALPEACVWNSVGNLYQF